ncbi:glycosyltransferase family 4 protein [Halalkalicoccus sp. GCM10025322]|uniref:glycosyltransferase family 4 protein n=1 Tax=Halalkalicoccus TaxID=332246 RepID=UPI002F966FA5
MTKEKLKVLVLATTFPRWEGDAVPQFIYELSKELQNNGLDVVVLAPHYPGAQQKEVMSGITVYRYPYFIPYRYQKLVFQGEGGIFPTMKRSIVATLQVPLLILSLLIHAVIIVKKEDIDIINSHWLVPNGLIAGFVGSVLKIPHILTLHARGVLVLQRMPFSTSIIDYIYDRTDIILPVSTHIRDTFIKSGGKRVDNTDKFYIQPMGAHTDDYDISSKSDLRSGRMTNNEVSCLFVGRLSEKKGVRYLLDAANDVCSDNSDFHLTIVGTGPLERDLQKYAEKHDLEKCVTFTGWISEEELHNHYVSADFVVVPSIETESGDTEGMPTVIAEAFASANPVIATDVGGISDVVEDGENGYIVQQKQPDELSEKIELLSNDIDLRQKLSRRALETADDLDWQRCGETYAQIIRSVSTSSMEETTGE